MGVGGELAKRLKENTTKERAERHALDNILTQKQGAPHGHHLTYNFYFRSYRRISRLATQSQLGLRA